MAGAGRAGQATVEAALLLPAVLTLLALLLQPACLLYTRAVMTATAYELARVVVTSRSSEADLEAFAKRRLAAVPEVPLFHEGGEGAWEIDVEGPSAEGRVAVRIEGRVRPLPLLGALLSAFGEMDGGDVVVRAEAEEALRAEWIGGSYGDWMGMWG